MGKYGRLIWVILPQKEHPLHEGVNPHERKHIKPPLRAVMAAGGHIRASIANKEKKMAKKCFAALLMICILGSGSLFADNEGLKGTLIGSGAGMCFVPLIIGSSDMDLLWYITGGTCVLIGLIWCIADAGSGSSSSSGGEDYPSDEDVADFAVKKIKPILEHVSLGAGPGRVYLGVNFRF